MTVVVVVEQVKLDNNKILRLVKGDITERDVDVIVNAAFLMTRYKESNATLVGKVLNHEKWIVFPGKGNVTNHRLCYVFYLDTWIDHRTILYNYL